MGCECLGPKKRQQQVYTKLIKEIHEQAKKVTQNQPRNQSQSMYNIIMERLIKKGDLRKLIDNLSSRRHKIQDALILNFKITSQAKQLSRYFTGLIVADSISQLVYPKRLIVQPIKGRKNQSQVQIDLTKKSISKTEYSSTGKITKDIPQQHHLHNNSPVSGIDEQYMKIMIFLLQQFQNNQLKRKVYESLNSFCVRHTYVGIIDRQAQIWKIIGIVISDMKYRKTELNGFELIKNLLICTKDQISEYMRNRDIIHVIFTSWLSYNNNNIEPQLEPYSRNCYQILDIYFHRFTSSWESQFLYENIFAIYDEIQFDKVNTPQVERLCQDLIQDLQFSSNFQKSLFSYLLGYLSIIQQNISAKKWLMSSLGINLQNIRILYKNALKSNIKLQCFKRLNAWIDKKYIDIDEFSIYSSKAVLYVYISNLSIFNHNNNKDKQIHSQILEQFRKTYLKLSAKTKLIYMRTAIEQFQDEQLLVKERFQLFNVIKEIIKNFQVRKQSFSAAYLFLSLDYQSQLYKKLEIIDLNQILLQAVSVNINGGLSDQSKNRVSQLLYSFYQSIIYQKTPFLQKHQLITRILAYLYKLYQKIGKIVFIPYYQQIRNKLYQNDKKYDVETQFSLLVYIFNIRKIINGRQIPENLAIVIRGINMNIKNQSLNSNTEHNNKSITNSILSQINLYFFKKDQVEQQSDQSLAGKLMKNQIMELEQYRRILGALFTMRPGDRIESVLDRKETYARQSSVSMINQATSNRESDRSFQEAIDIIQMR